MILRRRAYLMEAGKSNRGENILTKQIDPFYITVREERRNIAGRILRDKEEFLLGDLYRAQKALKYTTAVRSSDIEGKRGAMLSDLESLRDLGLVQRIVITVQERWGAHKELGWLLTSKGEEWELKPRRVSKRWYRGYRSTVGKETCGKCREADKTKKKGRIIWCKKWSQYVDGAYYTCDKWEPR